MKSQHRETKRKDREALANARDAQLLAEALIPGEEDARLPGRSGHDSSSVSPEAVDAAFNQIVSRLIPELQRHLDSLAGQNFGHEANSRLSKSITRLLRRMGCTIECPHCQRPAILRYAFRGSQAYFRYEHTPSKRHGCSISIGPLKLLQISPTAEGLDPAR